ncbi:GntR family transcriptional regulator [Actinobacillus succinogenes]|uniref:Transcriptional regulator, GntR family n=1 Tax=Actinobacillus succinogenes (strain ATCC 55618 / DSM 22257 / CCUG 43843 / 130Z) TaxID=339671 RepID=A6VKR9_ACTSZ|nr:GntR family transcriptional regulator [Actinobacillus succinogenes]ABR73566.1 transcriptional regulator, GntR family [Actinobacillus succinogenes 130Z]PHI39971.1 GntR family transcriptional regulator [Actinobacillus succinogenes]
MLQSYDINYAQASRMPRYIQIKYRLQQFLAEENWLFDKAIPSEQELANEYGVSIGTIRKAVEGLVEEGVLIKHQGKGTFLKHPAFIKSSMIRFYPSRDEKGEVSTPTGIVKTVKRIAPNQEINKILDLPPDAPLIYLERVRMDGDTVILSDKIWLSEERFGSFLDLSLAQFPSLLYPFYFEHCGQMVISAKEQMNFLLNYSDPYLTDNREKAVVRIRRTAKGLDGSIIEYRETYGLAENYYYETTIT